VNQIFDFSDSSARKKSKGQRILRHTFDKKLNQHGASLKTQVQVKSRTLGHVAVRQCAIILELLADLAECLSKT
jgi:hypothetical protein